MDLVALHDALVNAVEAAGAVALADYVPGGTTRARVDWKPGGSPVTSADHAVDAFLEARLAGQFGLGWHSEERPESWRGTKALPLTLVVDPIDGTRDFVNGGDCWCIVAGVLHEGEPVAGAVYMPARGQTYSAFRGGGAFRNGARITPLLRPGTPWRVDGPRPALEAFERRHGLTLQSRGSTPALAHRLLTPLTGQADVALSRAGGHDWDIVASNAILAEAGGSVLTASGERLSFGLTGGEHPPLMAASVRLFDEIPAFDLTDRA